MFYRIQDADEVGPFWGKINLYNCPDWSEDDRHPIPYRDSKLTAAIENETGEKLSEESIWKGAFQKFVYGFSSIEQLRAWFYNDEVIKWLDAHGFSLWELSCDSVQGNSQAVMLKSDFDSQSKQEISLLSLLDAK